MHTGKIQENKNNTIANCSNQKKGVNNSAFQFVDNRQETVSQRKFVEIANNSNIQAIQFKSTYVKSNTSQIPVQLKQSGKAITQLEHRKGESRVIEARKRKNANKRKNAVKEKEQRAQEAQEWSETVSEWALWTWEKAKGVGLAVVKKTTGGIDPFEVVQNLKAVYNSNASIKKKVVLLALYGSFEVSNYLQEKMEALIGGEVGEMMELEKEVNEQLGNLANLWENGAIEEGQVEEGIADRLIDAYGGE